ncbi:ATP-grasp domain-containing protein [Candidatus Woesearchaeota archaeon]|nr:ATP-grasp domain-containing protein [Candidatus Woesearchaeota archaeon]
MTTVLLTGGENLVSLVLAKSLHSKGVTVLTSSSERGASSFSKYSRKDYICQDYVSEEKEYIEKIQEILTHHDGQDIIIIPTGREIYAIAKNLDRFPGIKIPIKSYDNLTTVGHKEKLTQLAKELGIQTPKSRKINSKRSIEQILESNEQLNFPLMIKPINEAGGDGIQVVSDKQDLEKKIEITSNEFGFPFLVQEYIPGGDYCVTCLYKEGELQTMMTYRNLAQFPPKTGMGCLSLAVTRNRNPEIGEMEKAVKKICDHLEWHGVAEFDFRYDPDEQKSYLLEGNPRIWGNINLSVKSGVDYPYLLYCLAADKELNTDFNIKSGTIDCHYLSGISINDPKVMLFYLVKLPGFMKKMVKKTYHLIFS